MLPHERPSLHEIGAAVVPKQLNHEDPTPSRTGQTVPQLHARPWQRGWIGTRSIPIHEGSSSGPGGGSTKPTTPLSVARPNTPSPVPVITGCAIAGPANSAAIARAASTSWATLPVGRTSRPSRSSTASAG